MSSTEPTQKQTYTKYTKRIGDIRPIVSSQTKKNSVNISVRVTEETAEKIISIADKNGTSVAAALRDLIEKAIAAGITV